MMKRLLLLLLPIIATAQAADMPHHKPGLWELTTQAGSMPHAMQSKLCLDAASEAAFNRYNEGSMTCSKHDITQNGNQTLIDSVCTIAGSTVTSHGVLTWTGDTAYHMDSQSHWVPPLMGGSPDKHSTQDAKWIGACPAGVSPGDMLMGNGMKINILKTGAAHP
jgi:hypothetical protein